MGVEFECVAPAAPVDPSECTSWAAHEFDANVNPFALSVSDANALVVPILALWALAWVFRQCARLINNL